MAQVDGEDGVGSRALDVHLSAGGGARQSPELQALYHLNSQRERDLIINKQVELTLIQLEEIYKHSVVFFKSKHQCRNE